MKEYPIVIIPLSEEDGGGYLGIVPDLVGCMSDGETREEALSNTLLAIGEWLDEAERLGKKVPLPGHAGRSAHAKEMALHAKEKALIGTLKHLAENFEELDSRIQNLEVNFKELSEQAEHFDSWYRFGTLTGSVDSDDLIHLPC
jgi:antitoxin HicB